MCGRVALFTPPVRLARFLDAVLSTGLEDSQPSWNVGPARTLFGLTDDEHRRVLAPYRWGLIPPWASDPAIANQTINARQETVMEKPSFKAAYVSRPCILPVDGFYEWGSEGHRPKQPHYFTRRDGEPLLFAGLYEHWRDPRLPSDAPTIATVTVITTEPGPDIDGIHDRQPVVLEKEVANHWLDIKHRSPEQRHELLVPSRPGILQHISVGAAVGSVYNDGPQLIEYEAPQSLF